MTSQPNAPLPLVSVVVPTYREAGNLPILIERVFAAMDGASLSAEMVVVDDDSRDGADGIVAHAAQRHAVRLIVRQNERGLSSAVLRGFEQARGDLLVVMDADLSHPPERIPDLVRPVQDGTADFTIGSRYAAGGQTVNWGLLRQLNSKVATWLARPLTRVADPMSGFFCLRRRTWQAVADRLNPLGYKIALELIVKADLRRVVEIPITFSDRLHGKSKLTVGQQLQYLRHLLRLYRYRWSRRDR